MFFCSTHTHTKWVVKLNSLKTESFQKTFEWCWDSNLCLIAHFPSFITQRKHRVPSFFVSELRLPFSVSCLSSIYYLLIFMCICKCEVNTFLLCQSSIKRTPTLRKWVKYSFLYCTHLLNESKSILPPYVPFHTYFQISNNIKSCNKKTSALLKLEENPEAILTPCWSLHQ